MAKASFVSGVIARVWMGTGFRCLRWSMVDEWGHNPCFRDSWPLSLVASWLLELGVWRHLHNKLCNKQGRLVRMKASVIMSFRKKSC